MESAFLFGSDKRGGVQVRKRNFVDRTGHCLPVAVFPTWPIFGGLCGITMMIAPISVAGCLRRVTSSPCLLFVYVSWRKARLPVCRRVSLFFFFFFSPPKTCVVSVAPFVLVLAVWHECCRGLDGFWNHRTRCYYRLLINPTFFSPSSYMHYHSLRRENVRPAPDLARSVRRCRTRLPRDYRNCPAAKLQQYRTS